MTGARESLAQRDAGFAEMYGQPKAKMATVEDLLRSMDQAGIDASVILGFAWSDPDDCSRHNDYLLEAAGRSRGRLIAFCSVSAHASAEEEIAGWAARGARGLGEIRPSVQDHPFDEGAVGAACRRHDLIVAFHASEPVGHIYPGKQGGDLARLVEFAGHFPDVRVVAAHWGGGLPFYALMPEVRAALARVSFDTAASRLLYSPAVYRAVIDLVGAAKVLFGSDFPLVSQSKALSEVRAAGLTVQEAELVLGGNAVSLLGLT